MKFTRRQELALIEIGLNTLLSVSSNGYKRTRTPAKTKVEEIKELNAPVEIVKEKRTMSPAARRKISRRMKKVWAAKRASE
jgi:hypothetical protein